MGVCGFFFAPLIKFSPVEPGNLPDPHFIMVIGFERSNTLLSSVLGTMMIKSSVGDLRVYASAQISDYVWANQGNHYRTSKD